MVSLPKNHTKHDTQDFRLSILLDKFKKPALRIKDPDESRNIVQVAGLVGLVARHDAFPGSRAMVRADGHLDAVNLGGSVKAEDAQSAVVSHVFGLADAALQAAEELDVGGRGGGEDLITVKPV